MAGTAWPVRSWQGVARLVPSRQARFVLPWWGMARRGGARPGPAGRTCRVLAAHVWTGRGSAGLAGTGWFRFGQAGRGMAGGAR